MIYKYIYELRIHDILYFFCDIYAYKQIILCYNIHSNMKGEAHMYINDLGIGRIDTGNGVRRI